MFGVLKNASKSKSSYNDTANFLTYLEKKV